MIVRKPAGSRRQLQLAATGIVREVRVPGPGMAAFSRAASRGCSQMRMRKQNAEFLLSVALVLPFVLPSQFVERCSGRAMARVVFLSLSRPGSDICILELTVDGLLPPVLVETGTYLPSPLHRGF